MEGATQVETGPRWMDEGFVLRSDWSLGLGLSLGQAWAWGQDRAGKHSTCPVLTAACLAEQV